MSNQPVEALVRKICVSVLLEFNVTTPFGDKLDSILASPSGKSLVDQLRKGGGCRWVKASERLPLEKAFWNIEDEFKKDCSFPVRTDDKYSMGELFDQRLISDTSPKYSIYFNGKHHFENDFSEIEWLDKSPFPRQEINALAENEYPYPVKLKDTITEDAYRSLNHSILRERQAFINGFNAANKTK